MKVIVQDSASRKYLSANQTWTDAAANARDFHARATLRIGTYLHRLDSL